MTHTLPSRHRRTVGPLVVVLLPLLLVATALVPCAAAAAGTGPATEPLGVWPLRPRPEVVERFDAPDSRWGPGHRGVDLRGSVGQAVHAAEAGTVTFAGRIAGRGVVVVDHGSTRTTYEPVDATVSVGDAVAAGAEVGRLTLAGSHCFPAACLHWGLIEGASTYRDPLTLVGGGPVRLLPLTGHRPQSPSLLDTWFSGLATRRTPTRAPSSHLSVARAHPAGTPGPAGDAAAFRGPVT